MTPTPHSAPNAETSPEYTRRGSPQDPNPLIPTRSNLFAFDFAPLTSAIPAADREYFYGSLFYRELCDKHLIFFADFKIVLAYFLNRF